MVRWAAYNAVRTAGRARIQKIVVKPAPLGNCMAIACQPLNRHVPGRFPTGLPDQFGLADVFLRSLARQVLKSSGVWMCRLQHGSRTETAGDARRRTRVSLCIPGEIDGGSSRISRSSVTLSGSRFSRLISASLSRRRRVLLPRLGRVRIDAQPPRDLRDRIASLGNLRHRVPFELIAETGFARHGLLASQSGTKASTNPGAIHSRRAAHAAPHLSSDKSLS